jgi:hypothetical protein
MKKILLLSTLFLIFLCKIYGQSINNLDIKNGFRHLKFGSHANQISNIIKSQSQFLDNPRVIEYNYIGTDISTVFGVNVESINLSFFDDKLFSISVNFGSMSNSIDFEFSNFNAIRSSLEQTYGKGWVGPVNSDGIYLNGAIWDGNRVCLELLRMDFSKSRSNPKYYGYTPGYLHIFDKTLTKAMYNSEF